VVAASNLREILTSSNIEAAFDFIDTDHSGGLSLSELKARLGTSIDDGYYLKIIRHFNRSGDEVNIPNPVQQKII
jgi:Ca2+-binding EF-hand superfamily protein